MNETTLVIPDDRLAAATAAHATLARVPFQLTANGVSEFHTSPSDYPKMHTALAAAKQSLADSAGDTP